MIPDAPAPVSADGSAGGTLPMRAYRYCEPIRLASALGWYVFPPIGFSIVWDGTSLKWTCDGLDRWIDLDAAQFPKFARTFDAAAPEGIKGYSPQFLAAVSQPGVFQVWSGYVLKTSRDWYSYVRAPINLPQNRHAVSYEAIIETDRWFGPLLTNIRIEKTDQVIRFKRDEPIFSVHCVHRDTVHAPKTYDLCEGLETFSPEDWGAYKRSIVDRVGNKRVKGSYGAESRRTRKKDL